MYVYLDCQVDDPRFDPRLANQSEDEFKLGIVQCCANPTRMRMRAGKTTTNNGLIIIYVLLLLKHYIFISYEFGVMCLAGFCLAVACCFSKVVSIRTSRVGGQEVGSRPLFKVWVYLYMCLWVFHNVPDTVEILVGSYECECVRISVALCGISVLNGWKRVEITCHN